VTDIDPARVAELTERERARVAERLPLSVEAFDAFATAVTA
jgi:hypothetical protein